MLTAAQIPVFKAAILADANLAAARAAGDHGAIVTYYNANGASTIWKPAVPVTEMSSVIDWTAFVALTAIRQGGFFAMTQGGVVDATSASVRSGFVAIFGAGTASVTALTALAQRVPTRFEALFTVSQVCSCFGQIVIVADVAQALGS